MNSIYHILCYVKYEEPQLTSWCQGVTSLLQITHSIALHVFRARLECWQLGWNERQNELSCNVPM